ncbi:hypothetical protein [Novosphingobium album (ex Liu et al. 2023)]|uniref:Secreted protein n=1 Tax=Novosphingobium album (ex Liu et al. 2023) TaxID=3031130 RepID=A0ABT5WP45_9SPHN|nr:hypothetical protein [Novosphingobium album (ex Liu et al. 2023)]MDE8651820.1 hypothetical protein [Novosphingobium album (ex Liu et al. 2023)]
MSRTLSAAIAAAAFGLAAGLATPAAAQGEGEKVNQVIVYGDDPCPQSAAGEITVCARKAESERYRIPEALRGSESPDNTAWTNRVTAYETVGAFGTLSCSPVGAGGSLGCTQRLIDAAYAEKSGDSSIRFSELIAKEREKRLSTIDEQAAEQQARVEAAEKAYMERQQKKEAEEDAASPATTAPLPTPKGN